MTGEHDRAPELARDVTLWWGRFAVALLAHGTGTCGQQLPRLISGCEAARDAYDRTLAALTEVGDVLGLSSDSGSRGR